MALKISKITFNHQISDINELVDEYTSEFMLQGVPWVIRFCKDSIDGVDWFGFYLYCSKDDKSRDWSYTATSACKIVPFDRKLKPKEIFVSPSIFNSISDNWGEKIKWRELFDGGFVQNDAINLEIQVDVADPNDEHKSVLKFIELDKCCNESGFAKFQLTVSNVDALVAVRSPEFTMRNMPWNITIFKHQENQLTHLGIILIPLNESTDVSCDVTASFVLVSSLGETKCIKMERKKMMTSIDTMEIEQFVPWDQLLDENANGFVVNNEITFEVEIKTMKPVGLMANTRKRPASGGSSQQAKLVNLHCTICHGSISRQEVSSLPCSHLFCSKCVRNSLKRQKHCPLCGAAAFLKDLRKISLPM